MLSSFSWSKMSALRLRNSAKEEFPQNHKVRGDSGWSNYIPFYHIAVFFYLADRNKMIMNLENAYRPG